MSDVYLSIGSNKGDRFSNIKLSISLLIDNPKIEIIKKSKVYETYPMYNLNQSYFLNMVLKIKTKLNPYKLLDLLKKIEVQIGRVESSSKRNQPRLIDLDILSYDSRAIIGDKLVIPHPRAHERVFVLKPWTDIDPQFKLCNMHESISELLLNLTVTPEVIKYYKEI